MLRVTHLSVALCCRWVRAHTTIRRPVLARRHLHVEAHQEPKHFHESPVLARAATGLRSDPLTCMRPGIPSGGDPGQP
jgi:hypothetical protein